MKMMKNILLFNEPLSEVLFGLSDDFTRWNCDAVVPDELLGLLYYTTLDILQVGDSDESWSGIDSESFTLQYRMRKLIFNHPSVVYSTTTPQQLTRLI